MLTWIYDDIGCLRRHPRRFLHPQSGLSNTVGWVFGLSVFSLKGEHIGWFEEGVLFDIHNNVLGFIPGAAHRRLEAPALAAEPALPVFKSARRCRTCVVASRVLRAGPGRHSA
ncbi:hypothetical protein LP420_01580 [Massilia sp. B-10]|nr:hypothetical protein LP420_01580 [Massilia sp. B-10]